MNETNNNKFAKAYFSTNTLKSVITWYNLSKSYIFRRFYEVLQTDII